MTVEEGRKMISIQERKLALFSQVCQINRLLDDLKQLDQKESQEHSYTGRKAYVGLVDLIEGFDSKGK